MSFLDNIKNESGDRKSLSKITSDNASRIIKELSGSEIEMKRKKLIDNIIVVTNASGGTGASTIVSNLAHMMSDKNYSVAVIDLNILYPIQNTYFNIKSEVRKNDLVSYLFGDSSLSESIECAGSTSIMYANNRGLIDLINSESETATENFKQAIMRMRSLFDIVIIDCPMSVENALVNTAFYLADQIYIVWDESINSIANTDKIRRNMAISGIDAYTKMRVILNKKTSVHYSDFPLKKLGIELVGILPFESDIIFASLNSQIFCKNSASKSENASEFYERISSITEKVLRNTGLIE